MSKRISGINIAVEDLTSATKKYEDFFGVQASPITEFAFPGLVGTVLDVDGFKLNLISSPEEDTSVSRFLKKNGEGVFLLSVTVESMNSAINQLKSAGGKPLLPSSAEGSFGIVNFVHPKQMNGVQVELLQLPD